MTANLPYLHYEFDMSAGDVVEVTLDRAANVQLLDSENFNQYKQGQSFRYYGGHATVSPVRLTAPSAGRWHVVIDLGGGPGKVRASVRVLSGAAA